MLSSCKAEESESSNSEPAAAVAGSTVRLKTSEGDIVIALDPKKAPVTVKNFLKYVNKDHYDGTVFHRVIDGFMIQGGGFELKGKELIEKSTDGGIKNEGQNGLKNLAGTIAMARKPDPDSATAQFFINVSDNAALDYPNNGGYAVFGKVVEGMDVVNKIKSVKTGEGQIGMLNPSNGQVFKTVTGDVPQKPIVIESASVE
ncbi:peptidylprolyl isomerase [Luteolibacter sp. AS25]|uniref:peptidylprolyl isomerase n=1 Tax=Luteolibacter sp. AS25 TaxID=3135776 RepID=UPI00398B20C5